ncbi:MAG TPA: LysR family transcriptional regulator [Rheinheimera sp.]|nr:LysR family transcriptional regulator [Rheinheimera sp.]
MQDKLQALQIFLRVAQLGSFTKAGDSLGLSKTHVSNVVQQLEQHLGCRLLHRTTRSVRLTQDGQLCYDRSLLLLDEYQELENLFQQQSSQVSGVLRLDMSTGMARHILMPQLPDFMQQYPNIRLELSSTDRKVDLVAEGFDCVIRVGSVDDEGLVARQLAELPMRNLASPAYIARYGMPHTLADLHQHHLVHYVSVLGQQNSVFEYTEQGQQKTLSMKGVVTVNNADAYNAACLAGLGIIQAPVIGAAAYLQSGALLDILPQYRCAPMPVWLLYPHRRHLSRRLQLFMQWFEQQLQQYLQGCQ